jgi:hypothetical protein
MTKQNAKVVLSGHNDLLDFIEEYISTISPENLQGIVEWLQEHHYIVVYMGRHGAVCTKNGDYVICDWTVEENQTEAECIARALYRTYCETITNFCV